MWRGGGGKKKNVYFNVLSRREGGEREDCCPGYSKR